MLDDPAIVVKAEDVNPRVGEITWPGLTAVQDHVVSVREGSDDFDRSGRHWSNIRS